MPVSPAQNISQAIDLASTLPATEAKGSTEAKGATRASFGELLADGLGKVNAQHAEADHAAEQLAVGQASSVHDVVLSVAKADLAFRMVLEIRNRLIESYQEVRRMQI